MCFFCALGVHPFRDVTPSGRFDEVEVRSSLASIRNDEVPPDSVRHTKEVLEECFASSFSAVLLLLLLLVGTRGTLHVHAECLRDCS